MKNVLKLCLLMAMCLSLLLVVGCAKKDVEGTTGEQTTTEGQTETTGAQVDMPVDENPEGDPTDAMVDGTQEQTGEEDSVNTEDTDNSKKDVEVEIGEDTQPEENDFEVNFEDLT